jgi:hypothetical protein
MVNSVTSTSGANPAVTVGALAPRPSIDDSQKRAEHATKPVAPAAAETDSSVVQISQQGAKLAEQVVAAAPSASADKPDGKAEVKPDAKASTDASGAGAASSKPDAAFEPADINKDGSVTEFEQQAYDFKHPKSLAEMIAEEKNAAAAAGPGLKAYAEVARSGRAA